MAAQGLTDVNGPTDRRILAEWNGLDWRDCQWAGGAVRRLASGAETARCNRCGLVFARFFLFMKIKDVAQCNRGGFPSWKGRFQRRVSSIAVSTGLYELYRGHCTFRCAQVAARVFSRPVSGVRPRALSWVKGSAENHRIAVVFAWSSRCCCERC